VAQYHDIFELTEYQVISRSLVMMQNDVRLQFQQLQDESHFEHPTVIETVYSGAHGWPSIHIDPDFLRWAYLL
jgi:hypothetical protein